MFPTLSHLIRYLTGLELALPVQTFGFFVALAFWVAYLAFKKEFIRKEKAGYIKPFTRTITAGAPASPLLIFIYAVIGFIITWKGAYCIANYQSFVRQSSVYLFSPRGNILAGVIGALLAGGWIYWQKRLAQTEKPTTVDVLTYPHERTDRLLFWNALTGFIGSMLFAKLEQLPLLFSDPIQFLTTFNGLVFLGGFIFGAGTFLYITTQRMKIKLIDAMDVGSPGMMLAYGVGRMGCHLSGDGDWGIVNLSPKPGWLQWLPDWAWAFRYPHNVLNEGRFIPGCNDNYCMQLLQPVYPTSLYESVICLSLFAVLWINRHKFTTRGSMFFTFILCNGIERFFMEYIKLNPQHCIGGICLTQAQYISILFIIAGAAGLSWLYLIRTKQKHTEENISNQL